MASELSKTLTEISDLIHFLSHTLFCPFFLFTLDSVGFLALCDILPYLLSWLVIFFPKAPNYKERFILLLKRVFLCRLLYDSNWLNSGVTPHLWCWFADFHKPKTSVCSYKSHDDHCYVCFLRQLSEYKLKYLMFGWQTTPVWLALSGRNTCITI